MHKKIKLKKWPFLDQNHRLTLLEKCHFFVVSNFLFLYSRKTFFRSRISLNTFFFRLLPKKKLEKWPYFDENHGLTPLEKCQFYDFVNFLFLQPRKAFFLFQNIIKDIFLANIAKKKTLKKLPFFDQNHGLTPFAKRSFFRLFELHFFMAQKGFLRSRIS